MNKKLPVYIITGFLGSGKTTFINRLLSDNKNLKPALIENEVGEIGIDNHLLKNKGNIFEIFEGCVCCSVKNELLDVLDELIEVAEQFDFLVIETTGIAQPDSVMNAFYNEEFTDYFELKATICLVDTLNFFEQFEKHIELQKQILAASSLWLSKTDINNKNNSEEIRQFLKNINSEATIFDGKIVKENKLELHHQQKENKSIFLSKFDSDNLQEHHHHSIKTFSLKINGKIELEKIELWIPYFLSLNSKKIYRVKALLYLSDDSKKILQTVGKSYELNDFGYSIPTEKKENKWVFIGNTIHEKEIREAIEYLYTNE